MVNGAILYTTENVYFGKTDDGDNCVVCRYEKGKNIYYRKIFEGSFRESVIVSEKNIVIFQSIKDFAIEQGINSLLLDTKGIYRTAISSNYIRLIMKSATVKKKLNPGEWDLLCENAKKCANYISDLLGINLMTNPCSGLVDYKKSNITNIVIKATASNKFNKLLEEYIAVSLLSERDVIVVNSKDEIDSKLKKALSNSHIKETMLLRSNAFSIKINRMNHEVIEQLLPEKIKQKFLEKRICLK